MGQTPAAPTTIRWVSVGTLVCFTLLFLTTYEYLPWLKYSWGFGLLRYPPELLSWLLTGMAGLLVFAEAREGLLRAGRAVATRLSSARDGVANGLVFVVAFGLLVALRERVLQGDSQMLLFLLRQDSAWLYPQPGGLLLLQFLFDLFPKFGLGPALGYQILQCAAGAGSMLFVLCAARLALSGRRAAYGVLLLVFSGGLFASVAGRFDTQTFAVCASAGYLWLALRYLSGTGGLALPALVFGVAAWLQPLCLFAAPGLLWLPRLAGRRYHPTLALALLPLLLHTALLFVFAPRPVPATRLLTHAWIGTQGWLRGWGGGPSLGTDYVLLSAPHWKYLFNAAGMLVPAGLPIAATILLLRRKAALGSPAARFVIVSTAGLMVGSLALRPVWGPFDWDLFAVTALWIGFSAAVLLASLEGRALRNHLAVAAVGLQVCFVAAPLVSIGQGAARDGGLFEPGNFDRGLAQPGRRPPKHIARWL